MVTDRYGGIAEVQLEATGWFRLARVGGRHVFVTPDGHPYVALGINHIGVLGRTELFQRAYGGDWARAREALLEQLRDWGCTCAGYDALPALREMPHFASVTLTRTAKHDAEWHYPDVFDPAFQAETADKVRAVCGQHRDNRCLIGYLWTDTPCWDIAKSRELRDTDWVSEIRRLGPDAPGKHRYVEFLSERYNGDVGEIAEIYGAGAASFPALLGHDFAGLQRRRPKVALDDRAFLGLIAREHYAVAAAAFREHDPDHLLLGDRYLLGDHPNAVIDAAMPHLDALAVQPGGGYRASDLPGDRFIAEEFDRLHERAGLPIAIVDHQISFPTPEHPATTWTQLPTEAEAAAASERFVLDAFAKPYLLGYLRCQYIDAPSPFRQALKQGLLREDGRAYEAMVEAFGGTNRAVLEQTAEELRERQ